MPQISLTDDQVATLNQAERILHDLLPQIDDLEACDYDCQQLRAENDRIRTLISNLKARFTTQAPANGG